MNFTREPIILSVITPKEGSKLVIRRSKAKGSEEEDYFVDALEIVSFEGSVFFRSIERPKSFLLPASDYEILELKETKIVLKNVASDKTIKISSKHQSKKEDHKQRRMKRRRPRSEGKSSGPSSSSEGEQNKAENKTEDVPQPPAKKLIPPPHTLIKEKLARFKNEEFFEKNILPPAEEAAQEERGKETEKDSKQKKDKEEKPKKAETETEAPSKDAEKKTEKEPSEKQ